jgi:hypothetical protein
VTHRLRPRYKLLAWTSIGIGTPLTAVGIVAGGVLLPIAAGFMGIAAGAAYLASPMWRLEVVVDDNGLEVRSPKRTRFRVAWADIVKVVASPTTHTCFVDGGAPDKSLLVPGVGAPAPYDIADKATLYDAILARVAASKVETVERLELYAKAMK